MTTVVKDSADFPAQIGQVAAIQTDSFQVCVELNCQFCP